MLRHGAVSCAIDWPYAGYVGVVQLPVWRAVGVQHRRLDHAHVRHAIHTALSDQPQASLNVLHGAYYSNDRDGRPTAWHRTCMAAIVVAVDDVVGRDDRPDPVWNRTARLPLRPGLEK